MAGYARRGMVATSQPLAAEAGLAVLRQGGNAVDAAVATAAALTVLEPTSNGIGGDAFALILHQGRLYGLNASGPAPAALSASALRARGHTSMPRFGWPPVTVPGAPRAWADLCRRFGRLSLVRCLQPAIDYAEWGYPLSPVVARGWQGAFIRYQHTLTGQEFAPWFDTFAPQGRAPTEGEVWRSPDHARTLRHIADSMADDFYAGDLADRIDAFARNHGGFLRKSDLMAFQSQWVDPIQTTYRGYHVWELPPNGQGVIALLGLNILSHYELERREAVDTYHYQIEALKLAMADCQAEITDPLWMPPDLIATWLTSAYAATKFAAIGKSARDPGPQRLPGGGTVYLATADGEGNMVSYIQSNYMGFGSGLVVPGTGIALQNRGHLFSLNPQAANFLEPGKRSYHTIIPAFLGQGAHYLGPFGVMGGLMQPQAHLQVVSNVIDFHLNPQAALDAPRWQWLEGQLVAVEPEVAPWIVDGLRARGHRVEVRPDRESFGRGQMILRNPAGVLTGGTEGRADGGLACW